MKRTSLKQLVDLPNIGETIERDLLLLGIEHPTDLIGRDPYQLYKKLCNMTQKKHNPRVLDVFISAVKYMEGGRLKSGGSLRKRGNGVLDKSRSALSMSFGDGWNVPLADIAFVEHKMREMKESGRSQCQKCCTRVLSELRISAQNLE